MTEILKHTIYDLENECLFYKSLKQLKRSCEIIITTDSVYVKNGITIWIKNWKKKGWKNSKGQPVAHSDLIQEIDEYRNIKTIQFKHINSHQPEPINTGSWEHTIWKGNKIADQLATEGCNMNFKQE